MANKHHLLLLLLILLSSPLILSSPLLSIPPHLPRPLISATAALMSGRRGTARQFLDAHNLIRASFSEPPLIWDRRLARAARRWSRKLKRDLQCNIIHSGGPFGENLFWGSYGWDWAPADAVEYWAREAVDYDWESNSCADGKICGHFTQIVWNGTQRLGCGRAECLGEGVIYTCNYDPPGNWLGERPLG